MKNIVLLLLLLISSIVQAQKSNKIPTKFQGTFEDDYGSKYLVTDSTFQMIPHSRYNVIEWDEQGQYFLVQNDAGNKYMPNLFSKISIAPLQDMKPFTWAFCFTTYKSNSIEEARAEKSDASNPKQGCNGYPFSRMKPSL